MPFRVIKNWVLVPAILFMPALSFAQDVKRVLGYLDIFIGLFLAASVIMFTGALIVYFIRYGTAHREDVFPYMYWAITILFVVSVLLGFIHFFQKYTSALLYLLSIIVFILLAWLIIYVSAQKGEKKEKKK